MSALIDSSAGFVWACAPRLDGDPLFCALLEPSQPGLGEWRIELVDQVSCVPAYLPDTPILVSRLTDAHGGVVDVYDFCPRLDGLSGDPHPVAFARIVEPAAGTPRMRMTCALATAWGSLAARMTDQSNDVLFEAGLLNLRLNTNAPVRDLLQGGVIPVDCSLRFILARSDLELPLVATESTLQWTSDYWTSWVETLTMPSGWRDRVVRAAITLKLLQQEETGAIAAALTTSIPEALHSGRNWDYRYCWIRDGYYSAQALARLNATDVVESFCRYLTELVDQSEDDRLQPLYSVTGEANLVEWEAPHLAGYRGMGPVRVGNAAYSQVQNDVYGQIILSHVLNVELGTASVGSDLIDSLERVGEIAWASHHRPDASLWEFRTRSSVHTYSTAFCWAACDRLATLASRMKDAARAAKWQGRANTIRERIESEAFAPTRGHFTATFGGAELDASLLQLADLGFLDADDPRFRATLLAVELDLRRGDHLLRYSAEDDFGRPETAFNFCTFWLIEALHRDGRREEAVALFERICERLTPAGLLSEDIDFDTHELWGNYPQAYSLAGLINCAVRLSGCS